MSERKSSYKPAPGPHQSSSRFPRSSDATPIGAALPSDDQLTVISNRAPLADLPEPRFLQPHEVGQMLEGEQLGQFVLQKFVGGGGMGAVFRALDTTLNREVAVKVLSRNQSEDEETLRRFKNEAQSAARLDHDNIARVHYVGEDRGVHYIVFEFIEGVNIRDLVEQRGPLPLPEAVSYTLQVAEALAHASQRDVIHRDIKPSNVLITPDGKAKLVDMGLARLHQVEHSNNDLTASGVTLGTFDYISPEQARDPRSADVRSDLYSLGCSFYYMLTGRPPFPDGTVLQKLLQHQGDEPTDPRAFRPDLPLELSRILGKLLAKNPAQRYQQPGELIADLLVLGETIGLPATSSPNAIWTAPVERVPGVWQRHAPWLLPIAALLISVVALDVYWSRIEPEIVPNDSSRPQSAVEKASAAGVVPKVIQDATANLQKKVSGATDDFEPKTANAALGTVGEKPAAANDTQMPPANMDAESPLVGSSGDDAWQLPWGSELKYDELVAVYAAAKSAVQRTLLPDPATAPPAVGASGKPATATAVEPSPPVERLPEGIVIVSESGARISSPYTSLQAACSSAKSGDVIELRYDGRREERPISLANLELTIRAGAGYHPVISFRPVESDPIRQPRSMITIAGGELFLDGVALELQIPRDLRAESWTLFETRRANLIRLSRCSLTIRNAGIGQRSHDPSVAFFDIKAAPGSDTMTMMNPGAMEEHLVTVELENCIARGEATVLRSQELQSVRLVWDNGLLATSERLMIVGGGHALPRHFGHVQVRLRHLTAAVRSGLVQLVNGEETPFLLTTEIECNDSILRATAAVPLIEQRGMDGVEAFRKQFEWNGDRNCYEGFDVFWKIVNTMSPAESSDLLFTDWRDYWDNRETMTLRDAVVWKQLPGADRPFHAHSVSDYALAGSSEDNLALGRASDGLDAGCRPELLPSLPSEPASESGPAARGSAQPMGTN